MSESQSPYTNIPTTDSGSSSTLFDDVFDALAASHRRQLLVKLLSSPQHVSKPSGISREIAEADENLLQRHLSSSRTIAEVDEYSISMHHIHLPKLAEYGFIEWNQDNNLVVQGPRFDELKPHLKLVSEQQEERSLVRLDPVIDEQAVNRRDRQADLVSDVD